MRRALTLLVFVAAAAIHGQAQTTYSVKDHYTKHEVMIPMRDGVKLFTQIYAPKDASKKYPILMERTPYSCAPYGADRFRGSLGPSRLFAPEGYIFVYQDIRGRYMSEGEHIYMPPHNPRKRGTEVDESSDCYDTIDWLLKNVPNNNGRVGTHGVSQPGLYATHSLLSNHPALVCSSPQAPVTDRWVGDDEHHNGAFFLAQRFGFMWDFGQPRSGPNQGGGNRLDYGTTDGMKFFLDMGPMREAWNKYFGPQGNRYWQTVMEHPDWDEFWQTRGMRQWMKGIKPAVLIVGGLFDAEDGFGAWQTYGSIAKQSPSTESYLVMGPWSHGGWGGIGDRLGSINFGMPTGRWFEEKIELPFFEHYLKDKPWRNPARATVFETGANQWRTFDQWPPKQLRQQTLFLDAGAKVSWSKPEAQSFDEYVSDPANPVPYTKNPPTFMRASYMIEDQSFLDGRNDLLTYKGPPLDSDLTLAGPITADLWVSSTGTDSDFIVKLIDEFPADDPQPGFQMLVRAEIMRAKYRNDPAKPKPLIPGEPTRLGFDLQSICHRFKKGHRVLIQVQSSWFPLVDRNPQTFTNINACGPEAFQKVEQRVYRGGKLSSCLKVGVLP